GAISKQRYEKLSQNFERKLSRGLIPDITVSNLKYNLEFLVVEHGKYQSIDDKKKELSDTFKSCTLLHDMIRSIHNEKTFIKVFSVITSGLEMKIFELMLVGKELYIFQKIVECSLPSREQNCGFLYNGITTLIKLRILIDRNFDIYDTLRRLSRSAAPPQQIKLTLDVAVSPKSKIKRKMLIKDKAKKKKNRKDDSDIEQD
ncbi:18968_t:CDS:2, partial [Gigaspora rosea]